MTTSEKRIFNVESVLLASGVPNMGSATLFDEDAAFYILATRDPERISVLSNAKLKNALVEIDARFVPTPQRNTFLIVAVESINIVELPTEKKENK